MSYILDALKKAEKERKQGTLPDMLTVQDIVAEKPKKSYANVYFLVVALVLNAGVLVWWLGSTDTIKTKTSQTANVPNSSAVLVNEAAQAVPEVTASPGTVQAGSPETRPAEINAAPVSGRPASENPDTKSGRPQEIPEVPYSASKLATAHPEQGRYTAKPAELSAEKPKPSEGADRPLPGPANNFAEMPEENKIYKLAELPSSIRQGLPSFSVTALLYSGSPASRMVRVNEQMMREGQDLSAGVRLEEITRDGLVFSYHKYRFYVGAK
jgi:general secretion pathway protein B